MTEILLPYLLRSATGILALTGQPLNTETVVLDVKTYVFQTILTNVDGNILIGATASDSLDNLIAAIVLGAGAGTRYAASTTLHPTVSAEPGTGDAASVRAVVQGTGGNSIVTTETLTDGSFGAATLLGGLSGGALDAQPERATISYQRDDVALRMGDGSERFIAGREHLWAFRLSLPLLEVSDGRLWRSRMAQLARFGNDFVAGPSDYFGPSSGYVGPNPSVNGSGQTGMQLAIRGVASTTLALEGDLLSVGSELKILSADLVTDPSGDAVALFEPVWRLPPSDLAIVELQLPVARFRLMESRLVYDVEHPVLLRYNVVAIETYSQ